MSRRLSVRVRPSTTTTRAGVPMPNIKLDMDNSSRDLFAKKQGPRAYDAVTWSFTFHVEGVVDTPYTGYSYIIIKEPRLHAIVQSFVDTLAKELTGRKQFYDETLPRVPDMVLIWPALRIQYV